MSVVLVADIERIYTAFVFVALSVRVAFYWVTCRRGRIINHSTNSSVRMSRTMSFLAGQDVNLEQLWWILLDSLLWTVFGSRARSSPYMALFGQAGQARGDDLRSSGLGLHGIDVMLFFHSMRYLGEFLLTFPRGHMRQEVANRHEAQRREIAMVRAVGETLCVDPLFLALSVVTGGWDDNFTGLAMISALFSTLELLTELQYYATEAEGTTPTVPDAFGNDVEVDYSTSAFAAWNAVPNDVVVVDGGSGSRAHRPIEIDFPLEYSNAQCSE